MTLILSTVQSGVVVTVSDRRLSLNGVVVDEEATKLTVLVSRDARVCVAYTGLARAGVFDTEQWLLRALHDAAGKTQEIYALLEELRHAASSAFAALPDHATLDRRLTLAISGFCYGDSGVYPQAWKLTNWEHTESQTAQSEFQLIHYSAREPDGDLILIAGNTNAVTTSDIESITNLLRKGVGPKGIEAKLYSVISEASIRESARNTVGQQCNACVIWSNTAHTIEATYYSGRVSSDAYGVNTVFARGPESGGMVAAGMKLSVGNLLPPAVVPKVGRNEPCPCGSGEKYRHCHSRFAYPYLPIFAQEELNSPPFPPSGKTVSVVCRGAAGRARAPGSSEPRPPFPCPCESGRPFHVCHGADSEEED